MSFQFRPQQTPSRAGLRAAAPLRTTGAPLRTPGASLLDKKKAELAQKIIVCFPSIPTDSNVFTCLTPAILCNLLKEMMRSFGRIPDNYEQPDLFNQKHLLFRAIGSLLVDYKMLQPLPQFRFAFLIDPKQKFEDIYNLLDWICTTKSKINEFKDEYKQFYKFNWPKIRELNDYPKKHHNNEKQLAMKVEKTKQLIREVNEKQAVATERHAKLAELHDKKKILNDTVLILVHKYFSEQDNHADDSD